MTAAREPESATARTVRHGSCFAARLLVTLSITYSAPHLSTYARRGPESATASARPQPTCGFPRHGAVICATRIAPHLVTTAIRLPESATDRACPHSSFGLDRRGARSRLTYRAPHRVIAATCVAETATVCARPQSRCGVRGHAAVGPTFTYRAPQRVTTPIGARAVTSPGATGRGSMKGIPQASVPEATARAARKPSLDQSKLRALLTTRHRLSGSALRRLP